MSERLCVLDVSFDTLGGDRHPNPAWQLDRFGISCQTEIAEP